LKYRATEHGKDKRKDQCRRNRRRIKKRENPELEPADEAARVITTDFFRLLLRPARVLRDVQAQPEITAATLLLKGMPESYGACLGAGTAMEESPKVIKTAISIS
jgi:hypothetical protein